MSKPALLVACVGILAAAVLLVDYLGRRKPGGRR